MAARRLVTIFALAASFACGGGGAKEPIDERSQLASLLPPVSEFDGWTAVEGPIELLPETLYEYLDGGADRYLAYGFRELLHVRYQLGNDPLACVTLDVYDMANELGAFGIYSAARPCGVAISPWGAEGYRIGAIAATWKGSIYVHGETDDERPELVAMVERLVKGAAERAAGAASAPRVLAPLPTAGRVEKCERWVPADLLGHAFLPGGVLATYEVAGRRSELFLCELDDAATAADALRQMHTHLSRWGDLGDEIESLGDGGFRYRDPVLGDGTAVRAGRYVTGVYGEIGPEDREALLGVLLAALPSERLTDEPGTP